MSTDATPAPVYLTQWSNGRCGYMTVTDWDCFPGLSHKQGGSWRYDPSKSRLRPKLGAHWFKEQQP